MRGCSEHGLRHKVCAQTHTKPCAQTHTTPFNLQFSLQAGVAPHEALLLNSLRQLLSAAPAMEATVSGWCSAGRRERRRVAAAAEKPAGSEREGAAPGPHAHDYVNCISPSGGRLQVPSSRLAMQPRWGSGCRRTVNHICCTALSWPAPVLLLGMLSGNAGPSSAEPLMPMRLQRSRRRAARRAWTPPSTATRSWASTSCRYAAQTALGFLWCGSVVPSTAPSASIKDDRWPCQQQLRAPTAAASSKP